MPGNDRRVSRRNVLKTTGGAAAAFGAAGLAGAKPGDTVTVNVGYSAESGRQAALSRADSVVREFDFDALTIELPAQAADALDARGDVRYVEQNGTYHALGEVKWGVDRVDAEVADSNGYTGDGADVAIIDTGVDSDHPDLQAHLGTGKAYVACEPKPRGGCRFGIKPNDNTCHTAWDDDYDHGTHCAGIAGAIDNGSQVQGVATNVTIHSVKVLDSCGSGTWSDIAAGIEYTADQGWDVGSMSLGGSSGSSTVKDAVQYAQSKGTLLVAAAGNDGPCTDCVGYPAAYSEVVAVSSTNSSDGLSDFSSQGPEIELAAPGTDIPSTTPAGVETFSGTSMACPHVSGAAAILMANGDSNSQARQTLKDTAESIGLSSNESGAGLLDAAAAVGLDSSDST